MFVRQEAANICEPGSGSGNNDALNFAKNHGLEFGMGPWAAEKGTRKQIAQGLISPNP